MKLPGRQTGSSLIIVLSFIVLLTGLAVALLTRSSRVSGGKVYSARGRLHPDAGLMA